MSSHLFALSRTLLALAIGLSLATPAFAGTTTAATTPKHAGTGHPTAASTGTETPSGSGGDSPSAQSTGNGDPTRLHGVVVIGQRYLPDYNVRSTRSATRTNTALLNIPQAATVVTDKLVADQAMTSFGDAFRYMPGIGTAQGEGNRDTPVMRGISTTGDFYVDGIRDDVQYFRDMYNLDRVEALKGPNALTFGRGGSGGVINRITRVADGMDHHSGTAQFGSGLRRRGTIDYGTGIGDRAGFRVNAVYEDSDSFRDDATLKRYGINPTFNVDFGSATSLLLSYERFHDKRTADRGVPSYLGRPVATDPSTFFGNPELSFSEADVNAFDATLQHAFTEQLSLRNHLRWADYDKLYQNVFPGAVSADGATVTLGAYSHATRRTNLFNQTDLVLETQAAGMRHTLLLGSELGYQSNDNFRMTGYFAPGTNVVPVAAPNVDAAVDFRQSASDADNHTTARITAVYLQDQIEFSPHWQAIIGLRYDDFRVDLRNNRNGQVFRSADHMLSPRAGLIFKPNADVSIYASYSRAFQPRSGDQLASLTASNAALRPESFSNREIGAKWDIRRDLQASIAVYRLDRGNVAIVDPNDATRMLLVDGQNTRGVELGLAGRITDAWQVMGGYAWQTGEITTTQSATILKGNRLAQLPRHSASLWNRYDFTPRFGAGLGIVYRGALYANVDNRVTLPAFTRIDAALYWSITQDMEVQLNVENLGNVRYFSSAHSNNNISPGAPRSAWVSINYRY
ncbi:TonB-dependent siderophore receptor [Thermomonas sp.]|uniref:TonB-dependent receptor n=1 Tax=Thermomonas sp. TaxID=1971895 RepID=UPI002612AD7F|nr:TonB-dependent siderophore receptor [Thermomonas sp.]MCO5054275.1 TonB-dependent siderophore receptor [Thermomonas sp.]